MVSLEGISHSASKMTKEDRYKLGIQGWWCGKLLLQALPEMRRLPLHILNINVKV
jgi:hypothetical protein